jgi:hypothetical protein
MAHAVAWAIFIWQPKACFRIGGRNVFETAQLARIGSIGLGLHCSDAINAGHQPLDNFSYTSGHALSKPNATGTSSAQDAQF